MVAELERAKTEIALLREELSIKDARWIRVPVLSKNRNGQLLER